MLGRWAIAIKQPNRGALALAHVARQGFDHFNPLIKTKNKTEDLFPGMFFVDPGNNIRKLLNTVGVAGVIPGTAGSMALISDAELNRIKTICGPEGIYVPPVKPRFAPKQQVRVSSVNGKHCFEDQLGIYDGMLPKERARVLFGLVQASIAESDLIAA